MKSPVSPWWFAAPTVFLLAWGGNHFTPLLHLYETAGNYASWQANLLLAMYVGGLIPGLLCLAPISDSHGRKPVMIAGALCSILGSLILACSFHNFMLLCVGRVFAGVGVGAAMSVGSSWIKELSFPPFDPAGDIATAARRASMTLTLGFTIGAGVTGLLAQWGPVPGTTPFLVHGGLTIIALVMLFRCPESLGVQSRSETSWWRHFKVASAGHRIFLRLVVPAAPWIFGAAGIAYAIMPATVQNQLGSWNTLYATALTVATLGTGAVAQSFAPKLNRITNGHALPVGMAVMTIGVVLASIAAIVGNPALAFVVAIILGAAYGIVVVNGLIHVQRIASPQDLAGLTGIYYSLAYCGFLLPTILAALLPYAPYAVSLLAVAVICLICCLAVTRESRSMKGWREVGRG